nr:hypothetical protein [Marinicella sp. W31]MDC2876630.1 hypothetical protein [Marinicella sp. W31]
MARANGDEHRAFFCDGVSTIGFYQLTFIGPHRFKFVFENNFISPFFCFFDTGSPGAGFLRPRRRHKKAGHITAAGLIDHSSKTRSGFEIDVENCHGKVERTIAVLVIKVDDTDELVLAINLAGIVLARTCPNSKIWPEHALEIGVELLISSGFKG